jgi:hypothetical protein
MSSPLIGIKTVDDSIARLENTRQSAITPTTAQATVIAADIAYHRGFVALALKNGVSPAGSMAALRELGVGGQ